MAVYYASKAYVLSFSEAMRRELAPQGVRVTVVCPGPVLTEFQVRAGFRPGFDSAILNVSPAEVARQGYEGLMADKRAVLPGSLIKLVPFLLRFFPRSLFWPPSGDSSFETAESGPKRLHRHHWPVICLDFFGRDRTHRKLTTT
jgi:short-subunit dehydrogenase